MRAALSENCIEVFSGRKALPELCEISGTTAEAGCAALAKVRLMRKGSGWDFKGKRLALIKEAEQRQLKAQDKNRCMFFLCRAFFRFPYWAALNPGTDFEFQANDALCCFRYWLKDKADYEDSVSALTLLLKFNALCTKKRKLVHTKMLCTKRLSNIYAIGCLKRKNGDRGC